MRVFSRPRLPLAWILALSWALSPTWPRQPDGGDRLLDRFVEDAAVVPGGWLEGRAGLQRFGPGERFSVGPLVVFNLAHDFEFGFAFDGLVVDPDDGSSESGLSDLTVFGKARLTEIPFVVSIGAAASLPSGDEEQGLGTGEVGLEVFGAIRRSFPKVTLVGHAGVRLNQDTERALDNGGLLIEPSPGPGEGELSGLGGLGFLFLLDDRWSFLTEVSFETRRYAGKDSDVRLTPSMAYRAGRATYRAGLTAGLTDGAPDFALLAGAVLRF